MKQHENEVNWLAIIVVVATILVWMSIIKFNLLLPLLIMLGLMSLIIINEIMKGNGDE